MYKTYVLPTEASDSSVILLEMVGDIDLSCGLNVTRKLGNVVATYLAINQVEVGPFHHKAWWTSEFIHFLVYFLCL